MSAVNVTNVTVLDNPSMFLNPFQFEISYECLVALKDDLEWKLIYVGSAEDEKYDQVLESVLVGPLNVGNYRFVFQAEPPEPEKIPEEDIIGVTNLREEDDPPAKVQVHQVQRNILADKPRVTKFPIVFNPSNSIKTIDSIQPFAPQIQNKAVDVEL
ncbi:unnamed protein product [Sphagnum jensenii]|uniref:Anti-silencing factor n=1 Tax=Sphagnum jensenii TaxID=128206 RepID=A0ABP1BG73_9BRYO